MNQTETLRGIAKLLGTLPQSEAEHRALVARTVRRHVAQGLHAADLLGAGYSLAPEARAEIERATAALLAAIERAPVAYAPEVRREFLATVKAHTPADPAALGFLAGLG